MATNIIVIAEFALGYALTFLLIAFGIWVYRKIELRSLPWALAYLVLGIVSSLIFYTLLQPHFSSSTPIASQHLSPFTHFQTYLVSNAVWECVNQLLLALLILADSAILIIKAGGNLTGKFAQFWRWIYDKSTFIGCILVASVLVRIIWGLLYWQIL